MGSRGHKEGAGAVRILSGDMGKARDTEDDRKIKTQEGELETAGQTTSFSTRMFPIFLNIMIQLKVMTRQLQGCWPR